MPASFNLIIEDDAGKQIVVPFARDIITIGRKEGNTIRLTERNVSRFHAKLSKENGHVLVEDLKSFNGVKLNGDRIAGRVQVAAGDVIEIGDYHLELRSSQPVAPQKLGPAHKSAAVADDDAEGDEFEGDTQRWDPPPPGGPMSVGAPTQEAPPSPSQFGDNSGDTERLDMDKLNQLGGMGAQSWPPPAGRAPVAEPVRPGDLEPTARQPIAQVPIGGTAPIPPMVSPSAPTAPLPVSPPSAMPPVMAAPQPAPAPQPPPPPAPVQAQAPVMAPILEPLSDDATQDMPLPAARAAIARHAAEQTEQLRAAPAANPADDLSVPRLVVLNTIFAGSTFPLRAPESVLGRTDDNDIVLEHKSVSRNHAKLVREGERTRILDLKSANGVLVNNEEVETHVLRSGDIIELGKVKIRFVPVGERFVVAAEDIERARIADAAGDDFEEGPQTVNVTSPLRQRVSDTPATAAAPKPVVLYAVVGVLVLVVIVLLAIVLARGGGATADATDPNDGDEPAPTAVLLAEAPPVNTPPAPAADATPPPAPTETATDVQPTEIALEEIIEDGAVDDVAPAGADKPRKKKTGPAKIDTKKAVTDAQAAMVARDFGTAVRLLESVVEREPKNAQAHLNLGIAYARQRRGAKAKAHYEQFLKLAPTGPQADMVKDALKLLH